MENSFFLKETVSFFLPIPLGSINSLLNNYANSLSMELKLENGILGECTNQ